MQEHQEIRMKYRFHSVLGNTVKFWAVVCLNKSERDQYYDIVVCGMSVEFVSLLIVCH